MVQRGLAILLSYLVQVIFFKEIPNTLDILGSVIITATILLISVRKFVDLKARNACVRRAFCLGEREPDKEPLAPGPGATEGVVYDSFIEYLSLSTENALESF